MPDRLHRSEDRKSLMSVQLARLAVLDEATGKQVLSQENKTRQVYKEKPLTVQIEGGQKVTEAFEYSVALSGILGKDDKALLGKLASNHAKVRLSGFTATGLFLQGHANVYEDGSSFVFKTAGLGGEGLTMSNNLFMADPIYFPFEDVQLTFDATFKIESSVSFVMMGEDGDALHEVRPKHFHVPKFCGKMRHTHSLKTLKDTSYIHIVHQSDVLYDSTLKLA